MTTATRDNRLLSFLSLFTSLGTLFCCALPSLLVLLGLGATVASFLSSAPWLVSLSRHKLWVFALSGLLIAGNFYYVYHLAPRLQARALACPIDDPRCRTASRFSRVVLGRTMARSRASAADLPGAKQPRRGSSAASGQAHASQKWLAPGAAC